MSDGVSQSTTNIKVQTKSSVINIINKMGRNKYQTLKICLFDRKVLARR